ncbi:hypothetical protein QTG54_013983 [Skeletonema marinoi]|uniref:Uncharacterized protein n=1 Tax=Skeletonema marinoi TaxID=267567 RepID=A0AAD8XWT6_9STRA|nr:hypothetical protein QTG54_013983 [Skeletonema marinoi]
MKRRRSMDSDDLPSPRKRATSSLATIILCIISCKLLVGVHAFAPQPSKQTCILHRPQNLPFNHITRLHASIDDVDDDESDALLNELRDKKKKAFGKDLPSSDELEQAAKNAENDFLAAMLEQSQTFKEIKSEKGGDAAVSEFRRRIQEGDEAQRLEDAKAAAEESGEESMDKKWFVQQMEGIMEEIEEEFEDDSWQ